MTRNESLGSLCKRTEWDETWPLCPSKPSSSLYGGCREQGSSFADGTLYALSHTLAHSLHTLYACASVPVHRILFIALCWARERRLPPPIASTFCLVEAFFSHTESAHGVDRIHLITDYRQQMFAEGTDTGLINV